MLAAEAENGGYETFLYAIAGVILARASYGEKFPNTRCGFLASCKLSLTVMFPEWLKLSQSNPVIPVSLCSTQ